MKVITERIRDRLSLEGREREGGGEFGYIFIYLNLIMIVHTGQFSPAGIPSYLY